MERSIFFLFLRAANEKFIPKERAIVASPKVRNRSDLGDDICEFQIISARKRFFIFLKEMIYLVQRAKQ